MSGLNQGMELCRASFPKADGHGIWLLEVKPPLRWGLVPLERFRWTLWSFGSDIRAEGTARTELGCWRQAKERARTLGVEPK